jgi:hypothetical protein
MTPLRCMRGCPQVGSPGARTGPALRTAGGAGSRNEGRPSAYWATRQA